MKFTEDKKQFTARMTADGIELANDFIQTYENQYTVDLDSDRKVFDALVESALSKKKPLEISKKTDLEEIENLRKQNENILVKLENSRTEFADLALNYSQLETKFAELQDKNSILEQESFKSLKLAKNQVIVTLSEFQEKLINTYISDKNLIAEFDKMNADGKFSGVFDKINSENKSENISNFLKTVVVGSAAGKVLRPILSRKQISDEIEKFIKK